MLESNQVAGKLGFNRQPPIRGVYGGDKILLANSAAIGLRTGLKSVASPPGPDPKVHADPHTLIPWGMRHGRITLIHSMSVCAQLPPASSLSVSLQVFLHAARQGWHWTNR